MQCFKCGSELTTNGNNQHEFVCPNCNTYVITKTAYNIIPVRPDNNWASVLQNFVNENADDKKVLIDSDAVHRLFGY